MGNVICFDVEEFYFKFSYRIDKKEVEYSNISKYIQWTNFQVSSQRSLFGKILLTDITDHLLKNEEEIESIRRFVEKEFIQENPDEVFEINVTGSGFDIYKEEINSFFAKFLKKYVFYKQKLIRCLAQGIAFLKDIPDQNFFFELKPFPIIYLNHIKPEDYTPEKKIYKNITDLKGDIMIVNVRSGVSYYRVTEEGKTERVSGSIIGEATFAGLIRLLAGYENYMEALDEGLTGDYTAVDLTVGDIYGGHCEDLGLPDELLASSLGKAQYVKDPKSLKPKDLAKSIIIMFAINIGMMANMVAESADLENIIFQGFPHLGFLSILSTAFAKYNSKKPRQLLFVDNSEYVGCLGMNLMLKELYSLSPMKKSQGI